MNTNPFAEGENRVLLPPSTALVIFGASGDLTHRKLVPALYSLHCDQLLPPGFIVLGASRTKFTDDAFRDALRESVEQHSRQKPDKNSWNSFAERIFYQATDGTNLEDFKKLKRRLDGLCKAQGDEFNYLYYLATAPQHFESIAANLEHAGLVMRPGSGVQRSSLIVEKPFGHDLQSARALNEQLLRHFAEEQIFRIDHYLGKETVQNILVFRFANGIFEPLWNRNYVDHIQVSVCESIGVSSRAGYFDKTGILRDIVQNHLLQMLALLCIEPPNSLSDADSIRDEKVKVLRSIRRFTPSYTAQNVIRGQYAKGHIMGEEVVGYQDEAGISPQSETETFVALKLEIDNWRWAGVPIYVRAGKRLPKRITELTINFKRPPGSLFQGRQVGELEHNVLAIQVQPNEGISLSISAKPPGPRMRINPVRMDFLYGESFGVVSPDAYERLLLDAMKGDATLFTRRDEIEEAWGLLDPIFESWKKVGSETLFSYESGSWGPGEAESLLRQNGHSWRQL